MSLSDIWESFGGFFSYCAEHDDAVATDDDCASDDEEDELAESGIVMTIPASYFENGSKRDTVPRPKTLDEFIGNAAAVHTLRAEMAGANVFRVGKMRHTLLYGPPGTGKTTLAEIVAREQGYNFYSTTGSAIKSPLDLFKLLMRVELDNKTGQDIGCIFFDEIHDLTKSQTLSEGEYLTLFEQGIFHCPSLAGKVIEITDKDGETHTVVAGDKLELYTSWVAIGATTEPGMLSAAFRRRFRCQVFMEPYTIEDMEKIIVMYADYLCIGLEDDVPAFLAARSRANPARAISLLESCQNRCALEGGVITLTKELAEKEMKAQGVLDNGLTPLDVRALKALAASPRNKAGETVGLGLANLAGVLGVSTNTVSEIIEPYLKQLGFIVVTSRRKITKAGEEFLASIGEL